MDRISRPNDDFRESLTREYLSEICARHSISEPGMVEPEKSGNEKVIYYLDDMYAIQFLAFEEDEQDYRLLEAEPAFPTPRVIAWCDRDPTLNASYLITEKSPGNRLDLIWVEVDEDERLKLLRGLGEGMGAYHAEDGSSVFVAGDRIGLSDRISDHSSDPLGYLNRERKRTVGQLGEVCRVLDALGVDGQGMLGEAEKHLIREQDEPLLPPGLASEEPWEEHFIMDRTGQGYRLSGCMDFGPIEICDGSLEIRLLYASILNLDRRYRDAFQEGYETTRPVPVDFWERIHLLAADYHAWALTELLGGAETAGVSALWRGQAFPNWRKSWATAHYERLRAMLGIGSPMKEARFRAQIGPW